MKSQHPTDEFVRRKLAEQPPEFNEAHWEQALAMLEEGAKPGAFAWLRRWWLLLPMLLLGLSTLGWWLYGPATGKATNQSMISHHIESSISQETTTNSSSSENHFHSSTISAEAPISPSDTFTKEDVELNQADSRPSGFGKSHKTAMVISENTEKADLTKEDQEKPEVQTLAVEELVSGDSGAESFVIPVFTKSAGKDEMIILSNREIYSKTKTGNDKSFEKHNLSKTSQELTLATIPQPDIEIVPLQSLSLSRHRLGVMTSLGMAGSIGDPKVNGTTPGLGLVYNYRLGRVLQLEAGASYTIRLGLGGRMNFETVRYGFGYEREETTLDFRQRHMLEIPVGIAWSPAPRHRVHAGMNIARQLNVHGEITTVLTDNFGKFTTTTTRQSGYRQAYRPMDYSIQLGYSYDLSRRFNLQMIGQYGLTDLTPDDFWNEVRMDRNTQLRLQLNYFLVR